MNQIIERARYNGKKAAEYDFNNDYRTAKTYSEQTKDLARSYSAYKDAIYQAHNEAYADFKKSHKH